MICFRATVLTVFVIAGNCQELHEIFEFDPSLFDTDLNHAYHSADTDTVWNGPGLIYSPPNQRFEQEIHQNPDPYQPQHGFQHPKSRGFDFARYYMEKSSEDPHTENIDPRYGVEVIWTTPQPEAWVFQRERDLVKEAQPWTDPPVPEWYIQQERRKKQKEAMKKAKESRKRHREPKQSNENLEKDFQKERNESSQEETETTEYTDPPFPDWFLERIRTASSPTEWTDPTQPEWARNQSKTASTKWTDPTQPEWALKQETSATEWTDPTMPEWSKDEQKKTTEPKTEWTDPTNPVWVKEQEQPTNPTQKLKSNVPDEPEVPQVQKSIMFPVPETEETTEYTDPTFPEWFLKQQEQEERNFIEPKPEEVSPDWNAIWGFTVEKQSGGTEQRSWSVDIGGPPVMATEPLFTEAQDIAQSRPQQNDEIVQERPSETKRPPQEAGPPEVEGQRIFYKYDPETKEFIDFREENITRPTGRRPVPNTEKSETIQDQKEETSERTLTEPSHPSSKSPLTNHPVSPQNPQEKLPRSEIIHQKHEEIQPKHEEIQPKHEEIQPKTIHNQADPELNGPKVEQKFIHTPISGRPVSRDEFQNMQGADKQIIQKSPKIERVEERRGNLGQHEPPAPRSHQPKPVEVKMNTAPIRETPVPGQNEPTQQRQPNMEIPETPVSGQNEPTQQRQPNMETPETPVSGQNVPTQQRQPNMETPETPVPGQNEPTQQRQPNMEIPETPVPGQNEPTQQRQPNMEIPETPVPGQNEPTQQRQPNMEIPETPVPGQNEPTQQRQPNMEIPETPVSGQNVPTQPRQHQLSQLKPIEMKPNTESPVPSVSGHFVPDTQMRNEVRRHEEKKKIMMGEHQVKLAADVQIIDTVQQEQDNMPETVQKDPAEHKQKMHLQSLHSVERGLDMENIGVDELSIAGANAEAEARLLKLIMGTLDEIKSQGILVNEIERVEGLIDRANSIGLLEDLLAQSDSISSSSSFSSSDEERLRLQEMTKTEDTESEENSEPERKLPANRRRKMKQPNLGMWMQPAQAQPQALSVDMPYILEYHGGDTAVQVNRNTPLVVHGLPGFQLSQSNDRSVQIPK